VAATGGVAVVPGEFDWDDVGDVAAVRDLLPGDPHVLGDPADVLAIDAPGALVAAGSRRLVAVLGLADVVVLDTPDALLVTTREHAQRVKAVVDAVRERGRADLL
ncbi:MAG TPA: mannose-1-phosphate guanylyltransferase, partial [Actinotalea sp.]|nr:mannose-1-phosphate guanylyltransferase [Actinotalea sp.]